MDIEQFREYCLHFPAVTEELPFGPQNLVYKVKGKMFAICGIDDFEFVNLKCDPEKAIELREQHPQITPGYHMNKAHWNSVLIGEIPQKLAKELITHSYELVKSGLPKKVQLEIELEK